MKTIRVVLSTLVFLFFASACQARPETGAPITPKTVADIDTLLPQPGEKSMKGFELYSWQESGKWVFAVLVGTNREKTLKEIQSLQARLQGLVELKKVLASIPAGEYMTWLSRDSLAFPPDNIIAQVQELCAQQGLELSVAR
jgi:hypothetical protein